MTEIKETSHELSYFRLTLMEYLKSSVPELLSDEGLIRERSEGAAGTYAEALKNGRTQEEASTEANEVLFEGLMFSKFDTIMDVLTNEFIEELEENEFYPFALQMLPVCADVFQHYELNDDFAYGPDYDKLYTEITGTIQLYVEAHGIHIEEDEQ